MRCTSCVCNCQGHPSLKYCVYVQGPQSCVYCGCTLPKRTKLHVLCRYALSMHLPGSLRISAWIVAYVVGVLTRASQNPSMTSYVCRVCTYQGRPESQHGKTPVEELIFPWKACPELSQKNVKPTLVVKLVKVWARTCSTSTMFTVVNFLCFPTNVYRNFCTTCASCSQVAAHMSNKWFSMLKQQCSLL
jgi:hypothetical protein